jgi:acetate kinase
MKAGKATMITSDNRILVVNGGSSSIKFAVFAGGMAPQRRVQGSIDRIGSPDAALKVAKDRAEACIKAVEAPDYAAAVGTLMDWLGENESALTAVGHRVVHGGPHYGKPDRITAAMIAELDRFSPYDPEHLPREILLIETLQRRFPALPQVACFDTAFHQAMPRVAKLLPIPRRYQAQGLRRYGFHGLSYAYLMGELAGLEGRPGRGRVILAHLGSGASLAAVRDGRPLDTTMGFSPAGGLVMGTRSGDLDPGLVCFLADAEHMTAGQFQHMVNHESGLLGISGSHSDMRDLLVQADTDERAAEAVELFCYQAKKGIGAFTAALGGLDTLVFTAGIGENCPSIRARICEGLAFLGVELDANRNAANLPLISADTAAVSVRIIPTDEELMIARSVVACLHPDKSKDA